MCKRVSARSGQQQAQQGGTLEGFSSLDTEADAIDIHNVKYKPVLVYFKSYFVIARECVTESPGSILIGYSGRF